MTISRNGFLITGVWKVNPVMTSKSWYLRLLFIVSSAYTFGKCNVFTCYLCNDVYINLFSPSLRLSG